MNDRSNTLGRNLRILNEHLTCSEVMEGGVYVEQGEQLRVLCVCHNLDELVVSFPRRGGELKGLVTGSGQFSV